MYGIYIYANIWGILMGSMLPYIAAPWILWVIHEITAARGLTNDGFHKTTSGDSWDDPPSIINIPKHLIITSKGPGMSSQSPVFCRVDRFSEPLPLGSFGYLSIHDHLSHLSRLRCIHPLNSSVLFSTSH